MDATRRALFNWGLQTMTYARIVYSGSSLDAAAKKAIDAAARELWADAFQASDLSEHGLAVAYGRGVFEWIKKLRREK